MLEDNLGRDTVIPHISRDRLSEGPDVFHDLQYLESEDTFIGATRASFRRVLDNGEERPSEDAYKDAWLLSIEDEDSENDETSSYRDSSTGGESLNNENRANSSTESKGWVDQISAPNGPQATA